MRCPKCGSENIEIRLSFVVPVDLVKDADGVFRGEVNENVLPDFASFYCQSCHISGELYEGDSYGATTRAHISVSVEWEPEENVVLECDLANEPV